MIPLVMMAIALFQGPQRLQPGTGIVTGSIQAAGGSAARVRVAAMATDDPANLLSVAETDAAGRFRLTDVPAGRYYIVAGRLDNLTYYPGGTDRTKATEVVVEPARTASIASFTVPAESRRPPPPPNPAQRGLEFDAILRIAEERNPANRMKLLLSFERVFPNSSRQPEIYMQISQAYASQSDLAKAQQYAEKAVAMTTKMKSDSPPPSYNNAASWPNWVATLDASAKSNLTWVKQMIAWQQKEIQSAILRRR